MELFTIDTILPIASGALFITQAVYYLGLYNKLYTHSRETAYATDINTQNPPLSVIIVAKDATHELQENLPFILEQNYPEFEVIVIYDRPADDCDNTLKLLEDKYPNLYHTFIPDSARYISHKKLGITMGIKASRHEWLVFTEPDCRPQSNQWLKQMARNFTPATEIVLGYSNYEKVPGWFNKKITFDTLLNSMRYLGMAVSGHPYMGTGRNMAYRKTLYYKQKGFASHLNLQRGEDDLFINETARAHNTRVEASPESLMRIAMPKYKRIWCEEKISYAATSRLFHGTARYLMGFETCSRFLFYTAIIATITISILLHQWTIAAIAVLLWLARFTMQLIVFRKTAKVFGERKFCALLPLFDFLQPAWNGVFKLQRKFRRKNEFMRKYKENETNYTFLNLIIRIMIRLNVFIQVNESNRNAVLETAKELVAQSLNDNGCIAYDVFESATRKDVLMICETWKDAESLDAHEKAAHFITLVPKLQELGKMKLEKFEF